MKKIADIQAGILASLYQKSVQNAAHIQQVEKLVQPSLPAELQPFCRVIRFDHGILKFAVASAAWATRLRYASPEISAKLRNQPELAELISIEFYIEPAFKQLFMQHSA